MDSWASVPELFRSAAVPLPPPWEAVFGPLRAGKADDMVVVERIESQASGAPDADQPRPSQQPQLVRHGRFGHPDERGQVADATFAVTERIHQSHARRVAQQLEDLRDGIHVPSSQQAGANVRQRARVGAVRFGTREMGVWG